MIRTPETDLDVVDDHLVRYFYFKGLGDLAAAGEELERATKLAPDNLKAWYFRAGHARATNNLEGQLEAVERLREILQSKASGLQAVGLPFKDRSRNSVA